MSDINSTLHDHLKRLDGQLSERFADYDAKLRNIDADLLDVQQKGASIKPQARNGSNLPQVLSKSQALADFKSGASRGTGPIDLGLSIKALTSLQGSTSSPQEGIDVQSQREIGLYGTLWGLVIVHTIFGMPILTLLFRNYFTSLPEELFKAARVDGARFWGIYFQIMLPMSLPIFVVAMIIQVTGIWNDFLFGVVYTKPDTYPMTVQLNNIVNSVQGVKEYNVNMAATILTGLVPLIIYFVSGKLFVRGIAAGAVKG